MLYKNKGRSHFMSNNNNFKNYDVNFNGHQFTFTTEGVVDFVVGIEVDIEEEIVVGLELHNSDTLKIKRIIIKKTGYIICLWFYAQLIWALL